jgi:hypothetical protein
MDIDGMVFGMLVSLVGLGELMMRRLDRSLCLFLPERLARLLFGVGARQADVPQLTLAEHPQVTT